KPEDLSREIIQIQQREITLKQQNHSITSSIVLFSARALEKARVQLQGEVLQLRSRLLEEQKKREQQDALVRRLQKRVLLLTKNTYQDHFTKEENDGVLNVYHIHSFLYLQFGLRGNKSPSHIGTVSIRDTREDQARDVNTVQERDGIRAILNSYDSELASSEYSPQLSRRVKEAEEMLQKVQAHNSEMEVQLSKAQEEAGSYKLQAETAEMELDTLKKQATNIDTSSSLMGEEVNSLRQKIEELEMERKRLEDQNNILEMRLERHNLQVKDVGTAD
ncbi:hypothetical protein Z043_107578, partial [Scleropages formosus]